MNTNETSRFLDAVAADFIHEDVDLSLRVAARLEKENRPTLKNKIRFALALALILLAVGIALFRVPGVANAMKRMLGYIPGVGLVEEPTSLRVLAAPVSVTREGITLTVEQATLTQEKTVVLYTVEGIPQAARPKGESAPACQPATPTLSLPDGTQLQMEGGEGRGWENGYQSRMTFLPIPAGVDTAQFELPCLSDVAPGAAPQDWELSLRFVPAPPDLTVAPVIEVATPAAATAAPTPVSQVASEPFLGITLNLESMTQTERGYVLVASLRWEGSPFNGVGTSSYQAMHLSDANGKALDLLPLDNTTFQSTAEPNREVLAFSLEDTAFTPPLTLSLDWAGISLAEPLRFTFDPGPNPQAGQQWPLDQDVSLLGYPVHVSSARFVDSTELQGRDWTRFLPDEISGFEFSLEADSLVQALSLGVEAGFSADGSGTSGYSGRDEAGMLHSYALFTGKIEAPLTIAASYAEVKHPWQVTWNPADLLTIAPAADSSPQISIQIEQIIPVEDGYYLLGRTTWQDARFAEVGMGGWDARLQGDGVEVPIEPASFHDVGISDVQPGQWLYKVYGKALPASLTLQMTQAGIQLVQPYTFTFDPGSDPQLGQEWSIDQPLDILGYAVTVQSATFVQQGESHGFAFELEADPALQQVPLSIVEGVTGGYSWGGGSSPRDSQSKIKVYALTNGQFNGPVRLAVQSVVLAGRWQTSWNPPAAETGAQPQTVPQACVTLEQWNQSVSSATPAAVPAGLPRLLVTRGALAPEPSMFVVSLDGAYEQPLVFGQPLALTPDGAGLVYVGSDQNAYTYNLASGQSQLDGANAVVWSPDGNRYATWPVNGGLSIVVAKADGSGQRTIGEGNNPQRFLDWTPDSRKILLVENGSDGVLVRLADVETGEVQTLFSARLRSLVPASISPDGSWIAYETHVPGRFANGIAVSRLDGSEPRLLVQLDTLAAINPLWSPDGHWLAFGVPQEDFLASETIPALVNVETCQFIPLPWLEGPGRFWVQP